LDNTNRKEQHIKQHVGESSTEPNQTAKNSRSQSPLFPVVNRAKKRKGKGRKQKTHTQKEQKTERKECAQKKPETDPLKAQAVIPPPSRKQSPP
jgi:hypothetical protein